MLLASCSEYTVIPQYVSVQELNSLEAGMTKAKVVESLGAEPFDAFHSSENGCEYTASNTLTLDKKSGLSA